MRFEDHILRIEATLKKYGGLYDFMDILGYVDRGDMQMFANENSVVVTKVCDFPRRRILDIVLAYGKLEEIKQLEPRVDEYAKEVGASLVSATAARMGWESQMVPGDGWKMAGAVYLKELNNG